MAASLISFSAPVFGTTTATGTSSGSATGDYAILLVANKLSSTTPATPTDWQLITSVVVNSGGTDGGNTGPIRLTAFVRLVSGTLTIPAIANGSGTAQVIGVSTAIVRLGAGETVSIAFGSGNDVDGNAAWSVNAGSTLGLTTNDLVLLWSAMADNAATVASPGFTATGITTTGLTERADVSTGNGNDMAVFAHTVSVASGTATGNAIHTATLSQGIANQTVGGTLFIRVRGVVSDITVDLAASQLITVETPAVDLAKETKPAFVDTTVVPEAVEADKLVKDNVLQTVTVEIPTATASKHVVTRPALLTAATIEIPDVTVEFSAEIEVNVENIEVNVSLIGLEPDLSKDIELADVVEISVQPVEPELAKATTEPGDPQFITVELPAPTVLQSSFGVPNIPVEVVPQDVEIGIAHDLDVIDVEITSEEITHLREISLDVIDVEVTPEFLSVIQTAYALQPIDLQVEVPVDAVDIANEAEVDSLAISVSLDGQPPKIQHVVHLPVVEISTDPTTQSVITYQSYRLGIVEINSISQEPELAHAADIELISIFTRLDGQEPDLAHIFDIATSRLITVEPRPASTQGFDDEPININVELLPVDVGFSVEDFSYVRGLRVEPFVEPARVIAQDIRTKKFLHWELPVSNLTIDYNLSGPTVISGSFDNEILDLQDLGLEANATWIHVEENGFIRASGILQPTSVDENETLTIEAVGPSSYPTGQPYDNKFEGINLDPADIIRVIWNHLQSYSDANLGVVVRGNTPVKLGKPLPPAPPDPLPEGYVDPNPNDNNDKPYSLLWWEAPDCGDEIGKLISETPMDYVEVATWNADKTDVLHFIDLGFPRAGRRREDLSFVQDENLIRSIGPEELEGFWASNVILMGKGEGSSIIKGYAALPNPRRIRKTYIMTDPTCDNKVRADKLAMQELMRRQAVLDIKEIEADARHINARLGDFQLGDDIPVRGRIPWANTGNGDGEVYIWERVLGFTYTPDTESLRIRLRRSESFTYGSGATS